LTKNSYDNVGWEIEKTHVESESENRIFSFFLGEISKFSSFYYNYFNLAVLLSCLLLQFCSVVLCFIVFLQYMKQLWYLVSWD